MKHSRTLTPVFSLFATALLAFAQTPPAPAVAPPPAPPPLEQQAPAAPPAPAAPSAPLPPIAPLPPLPPLDIDLGDLDVQISAAKEMAQDMASNVNLDFQIRSQMDAARDQIEAAKELTFRPEVRLQIESQIDAARGEANRMNSGLRQQAREMARSSVMAPFAFAPQANPMPRPATAPVAPRSINFRMNDDRLYSSAQNALDNRQWQQAADAFGEVASRNGTRVDGALYWKAYALGKLGRRDEAAAAIAELRKSYASSRWMDDAKALELELKQASGQNVAPEAESDEELKLMAINGLMQSDPERAVPLLEHQLRGSASPKVKRNALFVLAMSSSPKAQALIEHIARGGANPDLQIKAIMYLDQRRKPNNNVQILSEIYAGSNDVAVKRAILQAHSSMRDSDFLLRAAKTEKNQELREFAIGALAGNNGTPELWQVYQGETTTEGKLMVLRYMYANSSADKLLEVVRTEKDPKVRAEAIQVLASQKSGVNAESLVAIYNAEQDPQVRQRILDSLYSRRNAKALVDIARAEKDTKMKLRIVERLSNMKDKEATDYLEEILKK